MSDGFVCAISLIATRRGYFDFGFSEVFDLIKSHHYEWKWMQVHTVDSKQKSAISVSNIAVAKKEYTIFQKDI